jgi:hypothetical protein
MACEDIRIYSSSSPKKSIANVTTIKQGKSSKVQICGSKFWARVSDLAAVLVGIISHETIHIAIDSLNDNRDDSYKFDEIGSVAVLSNNWGDIVRCKHYYHGIIGIDTFLPF